MQCRENLRYILITLMIRCEVVVIEDADVEDGVVCTDAHVADCQERNHLNGTVAVVYLTSLPTKRLGKSRTKWRQGKLG